MNYNLVTNIEQCFILVRDYVPVNMVYYSHIPSAITAILIGFFIYFKANRTLLSKILLSISISFFLWCAFDLILWTSYDSRMYMFFWSFMILLESLFYVLSLYAIYVFATGKDISIFIKIILGLLLLPIILLVSSKINLSYFSITDCVPIDGLLRKFYALPLYAVLFSWLISVVIYKYRKMEKNRRKEFIFFSIGIISFLSFFMLAEYLVSYLIDSGIVTETSGYVFELYGLFGMPIFLSFLAYLIVKFKAFDIKMLGAQALVWALVIITGAQFLFVTNLTNQILVAVTLIISSILGLILVRSVKKEVAQKEEIQKMALELEVTNEHLQTANDGQVNLMHLMNHQVKGKFGNNRLVFDELLNNPDYSSLPDDVKKLLEQGLEDSTAGVDYVQNILKGASAQNGTLPYDMKPMDLKQLIIDIAGYEKTHAEKSELSLETHISDGDYSIIGDEIQLREAFRNLIENAIKYNSKNGSIDVSLSHTGQKILFGVRDTGIGISKDDEQRLFKSGGMGKDSVRHNVDASGFGLAFVKPVIVKHGGRVWYESNSPEQGTTFFVEMPVKKG